MWKEMKPATEPTAACHASWYQRNGRTARSLRQAARAVVCPGLRRFIQASSGGAPIVNGIVKSIVPECFRRSVVSSMRPATCLTAFASVS